MLRIPSFSCLYGIISVIVVTLSTRELLFASAFSTHHLASSSLSTAPRLYAQSGGGGGDFELQELRVQLDAMKANGIRSRDLDPVTRATLENYMRQIATQRPSPVDMNQVASYLPNTSWRLVLSTQAATLNDLPGDATVYLDFIDESKMEYKLEFGKKTFGLNAIKAKSTWNSRDDGLITFVYDNIVTDAFGMKDMGVSFFGLLQGRVNYVQTCYFDKTYWIERGFDEAGSEFLNVYVREENQ